MDRDYAVEFGDRVAEGSEKTIHEVIDDLFDGLISAKSEKDIKKQTLSRLIASLQKRMTRGVSLT